MKTEVSSGRAQNLASEHPHPRTNTMLAIVSTSIPALQSAPIVQSPVAAVRMSGPRMQLAETSSRRAAILTGVAACSAIVAKPAFADDNDDMVARIAAKNALAAEAERNKIDTSKSAEEQSAEGKGLVGAALLGSVVLSVPFYYKNLQRLGTKISSGGKDSGY